MKCILVLCLLAIALPAWSQTGWVPDGSAVTTAPGEQYLSAIAPDGSGGFYTVWRDNRNGFDYSPQYRAYIQHMLADGSIAPDWDPLGIELSSYDAPNLPLVVPDGAGGVIVAVIDTHRPGYVMRIEPDGNLPWEGGVPISTLGNGHWRSHLTMISDGAGGAYFAWLDARVVPYECPRCHPNYIYHVFAQHIDAAGQQSWGPEGIPVSPDSVGPGVVLLPGPDHAAQILWSPYFGGSRIQQLDRDGARTWEDPYGASIAGNVFGVMAPLESGGAVSAFALGTDTQYDLYAQKIGADATTKWQSTGFKVSGQPYNQIPTAICSDAAGGAIVAWYDLRNGHDHDVYVQRVSAAGEIAAGWPAQGLALSTAPEFQIYPVIMPDGAGGAFVAWYDARDPASGYDIYVQRVLASGTIAPGWPEDGVAVCRAPENQVEPLLVSDGGNGVIVVWKDYRRGAEIYAQHVSADGKVGDQLTPALVSLVTATAEPGIARLSWYLHDPETLGVEVYRTTHAGDDGVALGTLTIDGMRRASFEDRGLATGRYGYRLKLDRGSERVWSDLTWVDVPASLAFRFHGFRPNPATETPAIAFELPFEGPASIELFDLSGRRVMRRDLGTVRGGFHSVTLEPGARIGRGLYWLRLDHAGRSLTTRGVIAY